jgi:hypothetical protein
MFNEDIPKLLARLQLAEEKLKAAEEKKISFKVSEKGALSIYGLNRFPVTLYKAQWQTIFANQNRIQEFIVENEDKLACK